MASPQEKENEVTSVGNSYSDATLGLGQLRPLSYDLHTL